MSTLASRYRRTILTVGPPHSGKSVFAYLLFKYLREIGDDSALFDCDLFGPTFRPYKLASEEEFDHIYCPPNCHKLEGDVPLPMFVNIIEYDFYAVREKGVIVMDGLGKHSEKTEALLEKAQYLAVVCRVNLDDLEIEQCNYMVDGCLKHPFEFYDKRKQRVIKIKTHIGTGNSRADLEELSAELYGLSREAIKSGEVISIPQSTCDVIREIAKLVRSWF